MYLWLRPGEIWLWWVTTCVVRADCDLAMRYFEETKNGSYKAQEHAHEIISEDILARMAELKLKLKGSKEQYFFDI